MWRNAGDKRTDRCIYSGDDTETQVRTISPLLKKKDDGKRRNLGTFATLEQAKQHEREVQYFKRH
jgi:hypothetical protein